MMLVVDIGNSECKWARFDPDVPTGGLKDHGSAPTARLERPDFQLSLLALAEQAETIAVASVVPDATYHLREGLRQQRLRWFLLERATSSIAIEYDPASTLGADRIANAIGGALHAPPPYVVVDVGTATTLDVVRQDGTFVGGAILPGPRTAYRALAQSTSQLPDVDFGDLEGWVGTSTATCLRVGLIHGYAAMLQGLLSGIGREQGGSLTTVWTGGLAHIYRPLVAAEAIYVPDLTLQGLAEAARQAP